MAKGKEQRPSTALADAQKVTQATLHLGETQI